MLMGNNPVGTKYLMEVSSNNFVSVFSASSTVLMNATVNDLLANGNYSVRVTAIYPSTGPASIVKTIYTPPAAPTNPILDPVFYAGITNMKATWYSNENTMGLITS